MGVLLAWESDYVLTERKKAKLVRYDYIPDLIMALKFNKVDVIAVDQMITRMITAGSEGLHVVEEPFACCGYLLYAVSKARL